MTRYGWRHGLGVLPVALVVAALSAGTTPAAAVEPAPAASAAAPAGTEVDLAIGAGAAASTSATGHGPGLAVDGSASTAWCATGWSGSVVVDLGRARALTGVGVTLGATASASTVSVQVATTRGQWRSLPSGRAMALNGGTPTYVPVAAGTQARWARLTARTGDGTAACVGAFRLFGARADGALAARGADLSFQAQEIAAGTRFRDAGRVASPMQILSAHGANYVRLRLWVDPPPGYSDLARDLELARQAQAAGLKIYLDIHYSDFWADPQHEDTPAAWAGQDLQTLTATVQDYTTSVMRAFARQGTPVSLVSIGNEIRNGMLWPVGKLDWTADTGWDNLATLLRAGIRGAQAANPAGNPLQVMIHFDQGGDRAASTWFYDKLTARGVDFDVIGLSYYTFWHGPLTALRENVNALARDFGKDIMVAEVQYAWTLANGDSTGNFVWQPEQVEPGYPASPGGQLSFLGDVQSILAAVPGGHGKGLFYWEPEWVPGVGWEPGAGAPNDNLTLFDFTGRALPSIGLFESPGAVCRRTHPYAVPCTV